MEDACDLPGKAQIPIARQRVPVGIERQPVALVRGVTSSRCDFEVRRALVHFIEHRDLQHLRAGPTRVVSLAPEETAAVPGNLILRRATVQVVPRETGE